MTSGLPISITTAAKASAAGPSYSLFSSSAASISPHMMHERLTDGVKPATAAKSSSVGKPTRAVKNRFRKVMAVSNANRIDTCSPETAATWRIPLIFRLVSTA